MASLARLLLLVSAAILIVGGVMHGLAFPKTEAVVAASNLQPFFGKTFLALWLIDSAALIGLGVVFLFAVVRPGQMSGTAVLLAGLIPAAIAGILYSLLGPFFAAHLLIGAAALAILSGLLRPTAT